MRNRFDEQLSQLNTELITMGALCEEAISGAAKYREAVRRLKNACRSCFDTDRFARAYYSDGSPLGTNEAADALPQAFSVFAGIDHGMSETALKTAEKLGMIQR